MFSHLPEASPVVRDRDRMQTQASELKARPIFFTITLMKSYGESSHASLSGVRGLLGTDECFVGNRWDRSRQRSHPRP